MWALILLSLNLWTGIQGKSDFCTNPVYDACEPKSPFPWTFPGTVEDLDLLCPHILDRLSCIQRYDDECGLDGMFDLDIFPKLIVYFTQVCNHGSSIREDVLKHLSCFKEIIYDPDNICFNLTMTLIHAYDEHMEDNVKDDEHIEYSISHSCIYRLSQLACFIGSVDEQCDMGAKNVVMDAQEKTGYLDNACPAEKNEELLELLQILEAEVERRDLVKEIVSFNEKV